MKKYPILYGDGNEFIPIEMMLEHEEQCIKNHNQTVNDLMQMGGTSYLETFYILKNHNYVFPNGKDMERLENNARGLVHAMAYEWLMNKVLSKNENN